MNAPAHRLDPLLRPRSVALVGASARQSSLGQLALANLLASGYEGRIYPVNPRYTELAGLECLPNLDSMPEIPEMVIFAVSDERIEAALEDALQAGTAAVTIMSALAVPDDAAARAAGRPVLRERVAARLAEAGVLCCGGNGMGFYNVRDRVWATGFDARRHEPPGNVALISQSGAGMCGIVDCDERLAFNLAVSTGQELTTGVDEYLDFALELPETRAVGLFLERARNAAGLAAGFAKARERGIPIVVVKTGRTAWAAELAISHCGTLAGDDAAYEALFDRYGVQRVRDLDELANALILFAQPHRPAAGTVVSLHDSGGERQLMVDLAADAGVELTDLAPATVRRLEDVLDPELPAVNPLDGWSRGGTEAEERMAEALGILMCDPGAAIGLLVHDRAPYGRIYESYVDYMRRAHAASGKPVVLIGSRQGTGSDPLVISATRDLGFPVLDGVPATLAAVRCLLAWRDSREWADPAAPPAPADAGPRWRERLAGGGTTDSATALAMLRDFGIAATASELARTEDEAVAAWRRLGGPVALKTAAPGIAHRSEVDGVRLGLNERTRVAQTWRELAGRFGPAVEVSAMQPAGIEVLLGMSTDPDLGPVVAIGMGGIHTELHADVAFALPPFDAAWAGRLIERLRLRPLLDGARGRPPADVDALCDAAARFSVMAAELGDVVREIDVNPLLVHAGGCVAVDALTVLHDDKTPERQTA